MEYHMEMEEAQIYSGKSFNGCGAPKPEPTGSFAFPVIVITSPSSMNRPNVVAIQLGGVRLTVSLRGDQATLYSNKGGPIGVWYLNEDRIDGSEDTCVRLGREPRRGERKS